ncbi:sigma-E factor regulatory protein RseB domain-containing protein [Nocardioides aurantiacus]|uniref:sigma-E factor regulatory protein RseB domain-containing protein n=1 Tax=Nocardioides aurantiacus TaxID=86796 RepID=UPI00403F6FDB
MGPAARWLVVLAVAVALVAVPLGLRAFPVEDTAESAPDLAARVLAADDLGWSGEVATQGSLEVPLSGDTFGGVVRLLGESSRLRVWWRGPAENRVDRVRESGETDIVRSGGMTIRWRYEGSRVSFTPYSRIRLPDDPDVVPVALAQRLFTGARAAELSRLPSERVAGRAAAGLRLVPADARSTIGRVDLWADQETGLPLRVEVYAEEAGARPVLTTETTSVDLDRPSRSATRLDISSGVDFSRGVTLDDAAGADAYAPFAPPSEVAGLPRRGQPEDFGAVGVYGRGPTALVAVPLRDVVARGLREQLRKAGTVRDTGERQALEFGPLSVLLDSSGRGNYVLLGTVTPETLEQAADDVRSGVRLVDPVGR